MKAQDSQQVFDKYISMLGSEARPRRATLADFARMGIPVRIVAKKPAA
jgi:hypothetical protein